MMTDEDRELAKTIKPRLFAVMYHFDLMTNSKLGTFCGVSKETVNGWRQLSTLPRVPNMITLCKETGITLDWIYRGISPGMDAQLLRSLNKLVKNNYEARWILAPAKKDNVADD